MRVTGWCNVAVAGRREIQGPSRPKPHIQGVWGMHPPTYPRSTTAEPVPLLFPSFPQWHLRRQEPTPRPPLTGPRNGNATHVPAPSHWEKHLQAGAAPRYPYILFATVVVNNGWAIHPYLYPAGPLSRERQLVFENPTAIRLLHGPGLD